MTIVRCPSCDGFGWFEDEIGLGEDCDWCAGAGYVYRDAAGRDQPIPSQAYPQVADQLEMLEAERLRELGYQGVAKKPWQQQIRQGTLLGRDPYADDRQ
ncbi:MAG: hypothetical protein F4Z39_04560 [Chloroflexi bacterium]|nr:hypothetical protein [Chloroflexota bacterium]